MNTLKYIKSRLLSTIPALFVLLMVLIISSISTSVYAINIDSIHKQDIDKRIEIYAQQNGLTVEQKEEVKDIYTKTEDALHSKESKTFIGTTYSTSTKPLDVYMVTINGKQQLKVVNHGGDPYKDKLSIDQKVKDQLNATEFDCKFYTTAIVTAVGYAVWFAIAMACGAGEGLAIELAISFIFDIIILIIENKLGDSINDYINKREEKLKETKDKIKNREDFIKEKEGEKHKTNNEYLEKEKERRIEEEKLKEIEKEEQKLRKELKRLEDKKRNINNEELKELEKDYNFAKDKLNKIEKEFESINKNIKELDSEINKLVNSEKELKIIIEKNEIQLAKYNQELEDFKLLDKQIIPDKEKDTTEEYKRKKQELLRKKALNDKIARMKNSSGYSYREYLEAKEKLKEIGEDKKSSLAYKKQKNIIDKYEDGIKANKEALKKELSEDNKKLVTKQKELKTELESATKQMEEKKISLIKQKEKANQIHNEIDDKTSNVNKLKERIDKFKLELEELLLKIEQKGKSIKDIKGNIAKLKKSIDNYTEEIRSLMNKINELRNSIYTAKSELRAAKLTLENLNKFSSLIKIKALKAAKNIAKGLKNIAKFVLPAIFIEQVAAVIAGQVCSISAPACKIKPKAPTKHWDGIPNSVEENNKGKEDYCVAPPNKNKNHWDDIPD